MCVCVCICPSVCVCVFVCLYACLSVCQTADKNYRMMFTPAPPKSAVPGRRAGGAGSGHEADSGSRAVSAASLRPTVSALATYRTPSPFITDGKDIDVSHPLTTYYYVCETSKVLENAVKRSEVVYTGEQRYTKVIYHYCYLPCTLDIH